MNFYKIVTIEHLLNDDTSRFFLLSHKNVRRKKRMTVIFYYYEVLLLKYSFIITWDYDHRHNNDYHSNCSVSKDYRSWALFIPSLLEARNPKCYLKWYAQSRCSRNTCWWNSQWMEDEPESIIHQHAWKLLSQSHDMHVYTFRPTWKWKYSINFIF